MSTERIEGTCNCEAVKVSISKETPAHICHCTVCRKFSGSTSWTVIEVPNEDFQLLAGKDKLKSWGKDGDAGMPGTRYWCDSCGSSVYITVGDIPVTFTAAGLFAPGTTVKPFMHLFAKHIESWDRTMEGAEVKQEMEGL